MEGNEGYKTLLAEELIAPRCLHVPPALSVSPQRGEKKKSKQQMKPSEGITLSSLSSELLI